MKFSTAVENFVSYLIDGGKWLKCTINRSIVL